MVSLKVNYTEEVFETESYKGRGSEEDIDNASVGDGKKKKTAKVTDTVRDCASGVTVLLLVSFTLTLKITD